MPRVLYFGIEAKIYEVAGDGEVIGILSRDIRHDVGERGRSQRFAAVFTEYISVSRTFRNNWIKINLIINVVVWST